MEGGFCDFYITYTMVYSLHCTHILLYASSVSTRVVMSRLKAVKNIKCHKAQMLRVLCFYRITAFISTTIGVFIMTFTAILKEQKKKQRKMWKNRRNSKKNEIIIIITKEVMIYKGKIYESHASDA